jgi:PAS domain S-box-containing protein
VIDSVKLLEKKFYTLLSDDVVMQNFLDDEAFAGIWFWDLQDRNTIWLSKSLRKLLGFAIDDKVEIPGSWDELLAITDKENICRALDKYVASDASHAFEIKIPFLQKNNESILLRCKAVTVSNKSYLLGFVQVQPELIDFRTDKITAFPFKKKETKSTDGVELTPNEVQEYPNIEEHASKYESLINGGTLGGWEYKIGSGELWCSKEYFDLLGYDTSSIKSWERYETQKVWTDLMHPDDVEKASEYFSKFLKNPKGIYSQNFRLKHADGSWVWILSKGRVMTETIDGVKSALIIGTHTDISESKRFEEELDKSNKIVMNDNALLKSIINSPEDIFIISIDTNYCYTSYSESYKKYVKARFGKDIHIGYRVLDLFSASQLPIFRKGMDMALSGKSYKLDVSIPLNSTELTYIENRYNPIQDEFAQVIGVTVFIQDVTKSKKAEIDNKINELRYTSLFKSADDAIFFANVKTGILVDANMKACELLGYEKSELIGRHQSMLHPIEDLEKAKNNFKESTTPVDFHAVETILQTKNGRKIPVLVTSGAPFEIGDELFVAAYFKDLTTIKEKEENASHLLDLLKTAEMLSTTGSAEFDLVNMKIIWSDEFFKILGYEPQSFELTKDSLYNHIHADDRDEFIQWQELAMKTGGKSETVDFRVLKNDGTISIISTSGISFADANGKIIKFIAVAKDITIRNRINAELKKQNQQLKEIAWTQSHVVRAPLTRIMGLVNALQKDIVPETDKRMYLKYVQDSANELDNVIKEITSKTISN